MTRRERSPWTLGALAAALLLVGLSAAVPWYSFHHSTGRTDPPGTPGDGGAQERDVYYAPFQVRGDATDEQREEGRSATRALGILVVAPLVLLLGVLGLELVWGSSETTRRIHLLLIPLSFGLLAVALVFTWFEFPRLLAEEGVTGTFTTRNDQGTFIRSTLSWGWSAAAFALVLHAPLFAFKFAGVTFTLAFLDKYRSQAR